MKQIQLFVDKILQFTSLESNVHKQAAHKTHQHIASIRYKSTIYISSPTDVSAKDTKICIHLLSLHWLSCLLRIRNEIPGTIIFASVL